MPNSYPDFTRTPTRARERNERELSDSNGCGQRSWTMGIAALTSSEEASCRITDISSISSTMQRMMHQARGSRTEPGPRAPVDRR